MGDGTLYVKASPNFVDLDTDEDGKVFLAEVKKQWNEKPCSTLVLDISDCFLDYWGCAPLIEGAIDMLSDKGRRNVRTLAILTTMGFGERHTYASTFFKGSKFDNGSKDFLEVACAACQETCIEFKIWLVPITNFIFSDLAELRNPNFVLSSR